MTSKKCDRCKRPVNTNKMLWYGNSYICRRCESTAYHEAGHAVIGCYIGETINNINIIETDTRLGVCCKQNGLFLTRLLGTNDPCDETTTYGSLTPKRRIRAENTIVGLFAGIISEECLRGRLPRYWAYSNDVDRAYKLGERLVLDEFELPSYMRWLFARTRSFIYGKVEIWIAIKAVAYALLENGVLDNEQFMEIYNKIMKTITT